MKTHTNNYKNAIKTAGRMIRNEISYTLNNTEHLLTDDNLYGVTPSFQASILKSAMKQLEFNCEENIPLNTVVNYKFGVLVNNSFEMLNFGNYVVYKAEKQEETNTYKILCYDKMLYSMINYENSNITYPITIRSYINAICGKLGLTFKNASDTFANYDKIIPSELYMSYDETSETYKSLGYTFRDVLDELAQVTASTICINEEDDELEVRYITDTQDTIDGDFLKNVNVTFGEQYGAVNTIVLSRSGGSDNIYYPSTLPENPVEIKISDNQIMNGNNRDTYLPDIYSRLNGLSYYLNDFSSTGITYYNLCDKYNVQIGNETYSCVMFNNEIKITQGLEENVYTKAPETSVTDYTKADKTDQKINQAYIIIDKQNQTINALVSDVQENTSNIASININTQSISQEVASQTTSINELGQTISNMQSVIQEQTSDAITTWFQTSGIQGTLDDLQSALDSNSEDITQIKSYYKVALDTDQSGGHYGETYVELGADSNQTKIRIYPDIIQFLTNGVKTAYISNNNLYISESTILTRQQIGHWVTVEDNDNNLNTYWVN